MCIRDSNNAVSVVSGAKVNAVLLTRNRSGVVKFALEINSVNSSEATNGSVGSFRSNQTTVVDHAIELTCCRSVQSTINASSLKSNSIASGCGSSSRVTASLDQTVVVDFKRVTRFSKLD